MNKITKAILFVFLFIYLIKPDSVLAITIFNDDFNSDSSLSKWRKDEGGDTWGVENGRLKGAITTGNTSHLFADYEYKDTNYSISFDSENVHGIDQHIIVGSNVEKDKYYIVDLRYLDEFWPQDGGSVRFWKFENGNFTLLEPETKYTIPKNVVNKIKISMADGLLSLAINDQLVNDFFDQNRLVGNGFGFRNYAGSYSAWPVTNFFDNVIVDDLSVVNKPKTVLIPGMGASWNEKAMVFNQEVPDSDWKMTPFVKNYEGMIESLGDDVVVWNYDWRKPVNEIVNDFDEFVDQNFGEQDRFSIVGHSLGGLVGRLWLEKNTDDSRIINVTTLGSPHRGTLDAYRVWAGGNISENVDVSSIALNVLVQLQKKNGENKVDTIRRYSPSLKDLLPTFDFIKKNGKIVSNPNQNDSEGGDKLLTISGIGYDTERWVKVGKRNKFEEILGWWPDGKIVGYEYADGDKTVLKISSDYGNNSEIKSEHGSLPDKFLQNNTSFDLKNNWVFYIGSPARLKIECPGEFELSSGDFIVINKNEIDGCTLKIVGVEGGTYHFVYGVNGDENSWGYREANIQSGEEISVLIDSELNELGFDSNTISNSLMKILMELKSEYQNNKNIGKAIMAVGKNEWRLCLDEIFMFRLKVGERKLSSLAVDYLRELIDNGKGTKFGSEWWYQSSKTMDKIMLTWNKNVSNNSANSYVMWSGNQQELVACYKHKNYSCVETVGLINSYLFREIISSK